MINLAIVSDIRLYREGVGYIIDEDESMNVVIATESQDEVLSVLKSNEINIMLLDMRMSNSNKVLSNIVLNYPKIKIIVIAVPENDDDYLFCAQSGITGYLTKESTVNDLKDALVTVFKGNFYCPGTITKYILDGIKHKHEKESVQENRVNEIKQTYSRLLNILTQREAQVVRLIAKGLSNKQIAKNLSIELSTVKNHVHNILVKMGVDSRTRAACILQESFMTNHNNESLDLDT